MVRLWTISLLFLAAVACSQRVTPEEEYAAQPRERALLPADAVPTMDAPGRAPAMPGAGRGVTSGSGESITVRIAWGTGATPSVAPDLPPGPVLFVFVRAVGVTTGPPLAVKRIPTPRIPLTLEIGPADAMIPGTVFPERVTVQARLDADGVATTTGPDDWAARSEPVAPGGETSLALSPAGGT